MFCTNHTYSSAVSSCAVALVEGDRISLVLSVAPLTEQYFIFRAGDPRDPELTGTDEQGWLSLSTAGVYSPAGVNSPG